MNRIPLNGPAEVRPAEDLATLAAAINAAHAAGENAVRKGLDHFRAAGTALMKAKVQCGHGRWLKWLEKNVRFKVTTAWNYMLVAREWDKISTAENLKEALRLARLTADVPNEDDDTEPLPKFVTLEQWQQAGDDFKRRALSPTDDDGCNDLFNNQGDNDNIEWALWSWNPVTGCLHNCPYCYARDIANRFYDQQFAPSLWPSRLLAPRHTTFPEAKAAEWIGHKNVFVCSMADLFGRWVPREWIDAVLREVRAAAQWNFLFLTKFPVRMAEFDFPENAWVGTTVDCQARVANAERSFRKVRAGVKWLSIEPMIEPLKFTDLAAFDWIVLGGSSRSSQTPEWHPPRQWVHEIEEQAGASGVRFYEKANLLKRVRQYPQVDVESEPDQAPKALRYLPSPETV